MPCDDPRWSNFWKYLHLNFSKLNLKGIAASFKPLDGSSSFVMEYLGGNDEDITLGTLTPLHPDSKYEIKDGYEVGDFRSKDVKELMTKCDIVITNPPFSLFREFVAQIMECKKQFIVIGNQNAITYKEIFPLIRDNELWLGYGFSGGNAYFTPGEGVDLSSYASGVYNAETNTLKFRNCLWFTNMDNSRRHNPLILAEKYKGNEKLYPKYDNYDAIDVSKTKDIPCDYDGVMGVPITFLDKYNPAQFRIIDGVHPKINGKGLYYRLLIQRIALPVDPNHA